MTLIRLNSKGADVLKLTQLLCKWGYIQRESELFDSSIDSAVRKFQQLYKLGADGIVGFKTWQALQNEELLERHKPGITKTSEATKAFRSSVVFNENISTNKRKVVSDKTIELLKKAADSIGLDKVTITSTIRFPADQARIMYTNLAAGTRIGYRPPGQQVTAVYDRCKAAGKARDVIIAEMTREIEELSIEGKRVSRHCVSEEVYKNINVIDVSYRNLDRKEFITALLEDENISKIIHDCEAIKIKHQKLIYDPKEPCIHMEIKC